MPGLSVLEWSRIGNVTSFAHSSLPLQHAATYVTCVRGFNGAGGFTELCSDGVALDLTPPFGGIVQDGMSGCCDDTDGDLQLSDSLDVVSAKWLGFQEPEAAIDHYEWCVGTSPGGSDVVPCHNVGLALSATAFAGVDLNVSALLLPIYGNAIAQAVADEDRPKDGSLSSFVQSLLSVRSRPMPMYYSTVIVESELGLRSSAYSNGVAIDLLAPSSGVVWDAASLDEADREVQVSDTMLSAAWDGFVDFETRVDHFTVGWGVRPGQTDTVSPITVPAGDSSFVLYDAHLVTGETYYATVTACDVVGNCVNASSSGVLVDATPPVFSHVSAWNSTENVGGVSTSRFRSVDADTNMTLSWFAMDDETGVAHYEVSLCPQWDVMNSTVDVPCVLHRVNVGRRTSIALNGPELLSGVSYVVSVQATSGAGLTASQSSAGFTVDNSPPVPGIVEVINVTAALEMNDRFKATQSPPVIRRKPVWSCVNVTIGGPGTISNGTFVNGTNSSLLGGLPFNGTTVNGTIINGTIVNGTIINGTIINGTIINKTLINATIYNGTVVNGTIFNETTTFANGTNVETVMVVCTEIDPPPLNVSVPLVSSLSPLPVLAMQSSWDAVAIQWTPWNDFESGVERYEVCVGTSPAVVDLVPCFDVGYTHMTVVNITKLMAGGEFATNYTLAATRERLQNFTSLYATVVGFSASNLSSHAVSSALQVDSTPPVAGRVVDGNTGDDADYLEYIGYGHTIFCAVAEGFYDLESGVDHYEVCLSSTRDGTCDHEAFQPTIAVPLALDAAGEDEDGVRAVHGSSSLLQLCLRDVSANHGHKLYFSVKATNGAGGSQVAMSDGFIVSSYLPDVSVSTQAVEAVDYDDGSVYGQHRVVAAEWYARDDGVPVVSHEVAVCGAVAYCEEQGNPLSFFSNVGLTTSITLGSQVLTQGTSYVFVIRTTNAAGRTRESRSDPFIIDTAPPRGGFVHALSYGLVGAMTSIDVTQSVDMSREDVTVAQSIVMQALAHGEPLWHAGFAPLHVAWGGFRDSSTGVQSFHICIGSSVTEPSSLAQCKDVDANKRYAVFTKDDINATAMALAQTFADEAVANSVSKFNDVTPDSDVDPDTGLVPQVNVTSDVRAPATALISVRACDGVNLCVVRYSSVVAIDLSGPIASYVSTTTSLDGTELVATASRHQWNTEWDPWVDMESGIAFYTVAVVDIDTEAFALAPVDVGLALQFSTASLDLQHGHRYCTEVVAVNHAGLSTRQRSSISTVVDTTPPHGGYIFDVVDFNNGTTASDGDADYGDAAVAAVEALWGEWVDEETGSTGLSYEWAVMVLDPRTGNPISASDPGSLLRDSVTRFLKANGRTLDMPPLQYGFGHAMRLHVVDNGVMVTDWLDVGNATTAFRADVDLVVGNTYVVLVRITNAAGLQTVASSDGIVFDNADPCMSQPHAGQDPWFVPRFITSNHSISATWGTNVDPLHQRSVPFECLVPTDGNSLPSADGTDGTDNSTVVKAASVAVVPVSRMEWRIRRIPDVANTTIAATPPANSTEVRLSAEANGFGADGLPVNSTTSQVLVFEGDEGNSTELVEDVPPEDTFNINDTSVVIMASTSTGPDIVSDWSGCCSSYSEHNPVVMREEWDWRPVSTHHPHFGTQIHVGRRRFLVVSGLGFATVTDLLDATAQQHTVRAHELRTDAGVVESMDTEDHTRQQVHIAVGNLFVFATQDALSVRTPPPAIVHDLHAGEASTGSGGMDTLFTLSPQHSLFRFVDSESGDTFTGSTFTAAIATHDTLVAVTVSGVLGSSSARAVVLLRAQFGDGPQVAARPLVRILAQPRDHAFGVSLTLSSTLASSQQPLQLLTVSESSTCLSRAWQGANSTNSAPPYASSCPSHVDGAALDSSLGVVHTFSVPPLGSAAGALVSVDALTVQSQTPSHAFGTATAAADGFFVVGDADAGESGEGQVTIFATNTSGTSDSIHPLCVMSGVAAAGGMGYSVSIATALGDGAPAAIPNRPHSNGTALVVAGAPGANLVVVIRVNTTANRSRASLLPEGVYPASVCQIVAVIRQSQYYSSLGQEQGTAFGAGSSVAVGGGVIVFGSPLARTWPSRSGHASNTPQSGSLLASGTGRVFGASFCWAGSMRYPASLEYAAIPSVCKACSFLSGSALQWSAGGISRVCEACDERVCAAPHSYFFTATNDSLPTLPLASEYEVDVTVVSRSGRRNTQTSDRFGIDWTPPTAGKVHDVVITSNDTVCSSCASDIDAQTNASYLAVSWCCGWGDQESGLEEFSVAFGHTPDDMDIMGWTSVHPSNSSFVLRDAELEHGSWYYGCVVAKNRAGLFSPVVCSDGMVYDTTPPNVTTVFDGIQQGVDVDTQSLLNILLASYHGVDDESGVLEYVLSFGTSPGSENIRGPVSSGNATFSGLIEEGFDQAPQNGDTVYANVFAINPVGLVSPLVSSNGVALGKGELQVDESRGGVMALDPVYASTSNETDDGNSTATDTLLSDEERPPVTVALVDVPAGAVSESAQLIGGTVTNDDVKSGDAVNASKIQPPAQNLRFGNYSFTLKARDSSGNVQEGYAFATPIRITMLYDVGAILEHEAAPADWQPELTIFDTATGEWVRAQDTCPVAQRYSHVNHTSRQYSVDICHLTQFALYYQLRPTPVLESNVHDGALVVSTLTSTELRHLTSSHLANSANRGVINATLVLLQHATTGVVDAYQLPHGDNFTLNGTGSFDRDGAIVSHHWSLTPWDAAAATTLPLDIDNINASLAHASIRGRGVVEVSLTVVDEQEAQSSVSTFLWLDAPPTASIHPEGATVNLPITRPPSGRWPRIVAHAQVGATAVTIPLSGWASFDPEGAALSALWSVDALATRPRYSRPPQATSPVVGSPVEDPLRAVLSNLEIGSVTEVSLSVTTNDVAAQSDTAVVTVVLNALPTVIISGPALAFLRNHSTANFTLSATDSADLDGQIVGMTWGVSYATSDGGGSFSSLQDAGIIVSNASLPTITVSNITEPGRFNVSLVAVDHDGGMSSTVNWTVDVVACTLVHDTDGDGVADCLDGCYLDIAKTEPGICGCGEAEDPTDTDGDNIPDCVDRCPNDPNKSEPGSCGCGESDEDSDGDILANCHDECPLDAAKIVPGLCGCGKSDQDSDGDGTEDCRDECPNDATRLVPGDCGCNGPVCSVLQRATCSAHTPAGTCGACFTDFALLNATSWGNSPCKPMPTPTFSSSMGPSGTVVFGDMLTFSMSFDVPVVGVSSSDFHATASDGATLNVSTPVSVAAGQTWVVNVTVTSPLQWCPASGSVPRVTVSIPAYSGAIATPNHPGTNNGFWLGYQPATPTVVMTLPGPFPVTTDVIPFKVVFAQRVIGFGEHVRVVAGTVRAVMDSQITQVATEPPSWAWQVRLVSNFTATEVTAGVDLCRHPTPQFAASANVSFLPITATIVATTPSPTTSPELSFGIIFSAPVANLTADDVVVSSGSVSTDVVEVAPEVRRRLKAPADASHTRALTSAGVSDRWRVVLRVTGEYFANTAITLGIRDGAVSPPNTAVPAGGALGDKQVVAYAPAPVTVQPGSILLQAGFSTTDLSDHLSLTVFNVVLDFGAQGVLGVTKQHIRVEAPMPISVVVAPQEGQDAPGDATPVQHWDVVLTILAPEVSGTVRVFLAHHPNATIVPPPATREDPILVLQYRPAQGLSTGAVVGIAVASVAFLVACCVGVCVMCKRKGGSRLLKKTSTPVTIIPPPPQQEGVQDVPGATTTNEAPHSLPRMEQEHDTESQIVNPTAAHETDSARFVMPSESSSGYIDTPSLVQPNPIMDVPLPQATTSPGQIPQTSPFSTAPALVTTPGEAGVTPFGNGAVFAARVGARGGTLDPIVGPTVRPGPRTATTSTATNASARNVNLSMRSNVGFRSLRDLSASIGFQVNESDEDEDCSSDPVANLIASAVFDTEEGYSGSDLVSSLVSSANAQQHGEEVHTAHTEGTVVHE